jgi:crotonobetainyl-CoA:carnitine CoA-transferase CaiB-like acyl-CoA transferase
MTLLAPYRVVDLTDARGSLAGLLLAQLGAEVVAVERPGAPSARRQGVRAAGVADEESSLEHWAFNRGKRSVALDPLDRADDAQVLDRLLAGADVLLESLDPADRAALGLQPAQTAARYPGLVHASITGFGTSGPKAGWRSTDLVAMAAGGYLSLTGDDDRAPVRISLDQAFHHAAADAAGAVLIGLRERHRSGQGQHIDVAAQASLIEATQTFVLAAPYGAPLVHRVSGGTKLPPFTLRLVQACLDGHVATTFLFGPSIGPFSQRLMEWIWEEGGCDRRWPDKDWVQFAMHVEQGIETIEAFDEANEILTKFLARKTKDELLTASLERRLLIAPVTDIADVARSPQLAERGYWETVDTPAGPVRFPGAIAKCAATPLAPLPPAPKLGEHTVRFRDEPRRPLAPPPTRDLPTDDRPLSGIKVLDFMWAMAGPAATRVLADYGATVVRVETVHKLDVGRGVQPFVGNVPGVDNGGLFLDNNVGKLGLALDLSNPAARDVVLDLVRWADVVCESFSPRAMRAWGFGYDALRAVKPDVIMLSSCLMGQTGPLASFAGFGNLAAAISGFHAITGWPDRAPSGPYSAYTDYVAPRVTVAVVLAALDHRARTGAGQFIDFSQAEASLHLLAPALLDHELTGRVLGRAGNRHPELCPHGVFRCAARGEDDDRWVAIAVEGDEAWSCLATELGRADLASLTLAERRGREDELEGLLERWTSGWDEDDLAARLQQLGVAAHGVGNSPELWADPQLAHRGHFTRTDHAVHPGLVVEASRFVLSRSAPASYGPPPTLGEHTSEILGDLLGYDDDRIADIAATAALE